MAKLVKSLVLIAAVLGLVTAAPSDTDAAAATRILTMATNPKVIAAAADPRVYAALVEAYPGADPRRALAGFCEGYVDLYNPECHRCNHSGCGMFQCSAFTWFDACKPGWVYCGYESCVGGLCSSKPTCGRKPPPTAKPTTAKPTRPTAKSTTARPTPPTAKPTTANPTTAMPTSPTKKPTNYPTTR